MRCIGMMQRFTGTFFRRLTYGRQCTLYKCTVASSSVFWRSTADHPHSVDHCVSFDIKSPFANVTLKDVIDNIMRTVFPRNTPCLTHARKAYFYTARKFVNNTKEWHGFALGTLICRVVCIDDFITSDDVSEESFVINYGAMQQEKRIDKLEVYPRIPFVSRLSSKFQQRIHEWGVFRNRRPTGNNGVLYHESRWTLLCRCLSGIRTQNKTTTSQAQQQYTTEAGGCVR